MLRPRVIFLAAISVLVLFSACDAGGTGGSRTESPIAPAAEQPTEEAASEPPEIAVAEEPSSLIVTADPAVAPEPAREQQSPPPTSQLQEGLYGGLAAGLVERVNAKRQDLGLAPLTINSSLQAAAESYAKFFYDYFTGVSFQESCSAGDPSVCHQLDGMPWDRAQAQGYPSTYVFEVLMALANPSETIVLDPITYADNGLFNSPPHAAALFSDKVTEIGFGCYIGPYKFAMQQASAVVYYAVCIGDLGNPNPNP